MLHRYAKLDGIDTTQNGILYSEFTDFESVSSYARDAMIWAINAGLISGNVIDGEPLIDPQGEAARAQAAIMLMKFGEIAIK